MKYIFYEIIPGLNMEKIGLNHEQNWTKTLIELDQNQTTAG